MKKMMVTGGFGFIGANFIRYMINEYPELKVVNIDNNSTGSDVKNLGSSGSAFDMLFNERLTSRYCFLGKFTDFKYYYQIHRPEVIVHFAAQSHVDRSITGPIEFVESNINGTFEILETLRKCDPDKKTLLVHISTDEVYGSLPLNASKEQHWKESDPYEPNSPYAASKASSDLLVRSYIQTFGIRAIITNCCNNYGPYQHIEKMIPKAITNLLSGKKIPLYGTGDNIREWIYVDDHVKAIEHLIKNKDSTTGQKFNIGAKTSINNVELLQKVLSSVSEVTGKSYKFEDCVELVTDRLGHDKRYAMNSDKIWSFGWRPRVDFNEGLRYTVNWYLKKGV